MQEYLTHSEAETEQAGADFARTLPDGKVVAMYGELGSCLLYTSPSPRDHG